MEFIKHIRGYQRILILTFTVFFLTITFETSQQLYYIKRFNLGDDVTYFFLLKSQAYRWMIWVLLSGFIFWFLKIKTFNKQVTVNDVLKYNPWISSFISITLSEDKNIVLSDEYGIRVGASTLKPKRSWDVVSVSFHSKSIYVV